LNQASEIQKHLLKKSFVSDKRFDLALVNTMAHEIGGDFYRVYQASSDKYLVACFDVAGKNVSGAMTTMALGSCFASFELFKFIAKEDVFTEKINAIIKEVNPPGVFVTAVLFYIDFTGRNIRIHNCGYSPVITFVAQANNKISYKITNPSLPPLGIEDEFDFSETQIVPITKGLRICAYSDGITDMMDIYGERYGEKRTMTLIKSLHTVPLNDVHSVLNREVATWIGTASLADDITLVDIRFN
jgi:sigma-B regulation protein RsbU (phosphoserine phosphatase)